MIADNSIARKKRYLEVNLVKDKRHFRLEYQRNYLK